MTDKQRLIALLDSFGVGYTQGSCDEDETVRCMADEAKIDGYSGFFTDFIFNVDGSFSHMGAWE